MAGVAAGLTVAVAAGAMEGVALNGMEGEGRTLAGGEAIALGDAGAAGAVTDADGALAGVAEGDAASDGAIEGVAFGMADGDGRILMEGEATGLALAAVAAVAAGVALGAAVAVTGVALAVVVAVAADVAAGVTVAVDVSVGFTNFFDGALGGGVASALILVRARSAAERSAIAVQPVSIITSATRSFTVRGRGISGSSTITGADTSSSSPRTVAGAISAFICNCRRKR